MTLLINTLDLSPQSRSAVSEETVRTYAETMRDNRELPVNERTDFPPVKVMRVDARTKTNAALLKSPGKTEPYSSAVIRHPNNSPRYVAFLTPRQAISSI